MTEERDWLEAILKRKAYDESPIKVLEVETCESGIARGENYMSSIERVKAKILLGSGKVKNLPLIIKNEHNTPHMKQFSVDSGVFVKEIAMYRDVLPKMEVLLEEIGESDEVFWPKCYDIRLFDRLVFEDLNVQGYKMFDRKQQLGVDGALLVIVHLAKFHALSKILLERGEISKMNFEGNLWTSSREFTSKSFTSNRNMLVAAMEKWGDEWKEARDRVSSADLTDGYMKALQLKPEEFSVLCHGDPWLNNFLFRGGDPEKPKSVMFLDMQLALITSPAKDISYFLLTSVKQDVREQHFDSLVQTYVETLKTYLSKLGYEGPVPDDDQIKKALDERAVMRLFEATILTPIIMGDHKNIPDMEELVVQSLEAEKNGGTPQVWNVYEALSPAAERIIKSEIRAAMDVGLI